LRHQGAKLAVAEALRQEPKHHQRAQHHLDARVP
jgi:hypothetical protein